MDFAALLKQPRVWLAGLVLALVAVLAFWYVRRPTDADGNSLILSNKEEKHIHQDLRQQAAQRTHDSLQSTRADSAATALYQQGQHAAAAAIRLHQRTHEKTTTTDTSAQQLQKQLSGY